MDASSPKRKDPSRNIPGRVILVAIEGPRRPWWLPVAMFVGGVAVAAVGGAADRRVLVLLGVPTAFLAILWTVTRLAQFSYYKTLARTVDFSRCIRCGYSLQGLESGVCPECGTDSRHLAAKAAQATGVRVPKR